MNANKKTKIALSIAALSLVPAWAFADISISVNIAPPELPVYDQPPCPQDGYLWTPGYWAYDNDGGYFWVPGTWVLAPQPNYLWTPPWWGWEGAVYVFHAGYWGPHVGFYGGVNYGYGYGGRGYEGGRWDGGHFAYNTTVNNVNVTNIHNTYTTTVVNNVTVNRVSFNGGNGGVQAQPSAQEREAEHESHLPPTSNQDSHRQEAKANPQQHFEANHGHPGVAATPRAGAPMTEPKAGEKDGPGPRNEERPEAAHPGTAEAGKPAESSRPDENRSAMAPKHPATPAQAPHPAAPPRPATPHPQQRPPAPRPHPAPHPQQPRPPEHHEGGENEHH